MYCLNLQIYASLDELVATAIYERLAETYKLPSIQTLQLAMSEEIEWTCDPSTQVYFMDNLREENRRDVFQLRFHVSVESKTYTTLFVSVEKRTAQVHTLSIQFGHRGDRRCASAIIGWLKDLVIQQHVRVDCEIAGFGERQGYRAICEHALTAFVWNEAARRYLHVTDQVTEVKEIKKGMAWRKPGV